MKPTDAILKAWHHVLSQRPTAPAVRGTDGRVLRTFTQLESGGEFFYETLRRFAPGSVVAIQIGNHEDWPAAFIGCLRAKLAVLPLEQSVTEAQRDAIFGTCGVAALISAGRHATSEFGRIDVTPLPSSSVINWNGERPSLLKLTSGTTAAPRVIRLRSEQLLADCENICATMNISESDLNFGVIPISHSYGFSNLLTPLLARGVPLVVSRDRTPQAILADLERTRATVFPGMPIFYQAFTEIPRKLPDLRLCISAGAPLSATVAQRFRERFDLPIHSFYGASECGGICYDRAGTAECEGFVGTPMDHVEIELIDSGGQASQLRVSSTAVADGYFPEPDQGKLGNGSFVPDDLLVQRKSGLQIVGRVSDVINVAGKKVNPAEVEAQVLRFPGVRQAVAFARESDRRSEEVALCVVTEPGLREADLLEYCRTNLDPSHVPKRIFFVDAIPVNERGKISRRLLAQQFRQK